MSKTSLPGTRKGFKWTLKKLQAARMLAEGSHNHTNIAEKLGVAVSSIGNWKAHPDFRKKVEMYLSEINESVLSMGIANKSVRLGRLNERFQQIQTIVKERGEDMGEVPGGGTGLLTRDAKGVAGERVDVYKVDVGMLAEEREIAKQAAIEMGQWNKNDGQADNRPPAPITERITNIIAIFNGARERRDRATDTEDSGELPIPARMVSQVPNTGVEQQS